MQNLQQVVSCTKIQITFCFLGPLTLQKEDGKEYLIGINSWGLGCANGLPSVFSKAAVEYEAIKWFAAGDNYIEQCQ